MILLALDIGNSYTKGAIFADGRLLTAAQAPTARLAEKPNRWVKALLKKAQAEEKCLEGVAIASTVPLATAHWQKYCLENSAQQPFLIKPKSSSLLAINYRPASSLGPDRFVNALAASKFYRPPLICISLGTATVVDVVSKNREFLGGAILPGVELFLSALAKKTALLPEKKLASISSPVGNNTAAALRTGAIIGTAAAVDGLVARFREQIGKNAKVIITGGHAPLILPQLRATRIYHRPFLPLEGIWLAWQNHRSPLK